MWTGRRQHSLFSSMPTNFDGANSSFRLHCASTANTYALLNPTVVLLSYRTYNLNQYLIFWKRLYIYQIYKMLWLLIIPTIHSSMCWYNYYIIIAFNFFHSLSSNVKYIHCHICIYTCCLYLLQLTYVGAFLCIFFCLERFSISPRLSTQSYCIWTCIFGV